MPPSKDQTVKYWIIFYLTLERNWLMSKFTVSSEAVCCRCRCCWRNTQHTLSLSLSLSLFTKQDHVHEQATYLNELDNYLNIFPLLLQWSPINERGCFKLGACVRPRGINFTKAHIWAWGWLVGVGGGNWFNVSEVMPATQNTSTHTDRSHKKGRERLPDWLWPQHIYIHTPGRCHHVS